jgi:hypothetical protein
MKLYKNLLESFYLNFSFESHECLKQELLKLILLNSETLKIKDGYYGDSVTNLDWSLASDFSRPWTKLLLPFLEQELKKVCQACGYITPYINELWFQQYHQADTHGWHVHGSNFTGVYYLDLPTGSPITQLVNPWNQETIINPNVKEGDILIFPSYVIHRAPKIMTDVKKTIISFNCNFDMVDPKILNNITITGERKIETVR